NEQQADRMATRHQREDGEGPPRIGVRSSRRRRSCPGRAVGAAARDYLKTVAAGSSHSGVDAATIARANAATDCSRSAMVCTDEQNALVFRMSMPSARIALAIRACADGAPRKI